MLHSLGPWSYSMDQCDFCHCVLVATLAQAVEGQEEQGQGYSWSGSYTAPNAIYTRAVHLCKLQLVYTSNLNLYIPWLPGLCSCNLQLALITTISYGPCPSCADGDLHSCSLHWLLSIISNCTALLQLAHWCCMMMHHSWVWCVYKGSLCCLCVGTFSGLNVFYKICRYIYSGIA